MAETQLIDLSTLDPESRRNLHRILYRQECRAWLLSCAVGLGTLGLALQFQERFAWEHEMIGCFVVVYSCYISLWVIYPTQKLLGLLRQSGDSMEGWDIEKKFDDNWRSLWDFVPPLLIPVMFYLVILLLRLKFAI